jgi:hypothetical protein
MLRWKRFLIEKVELACFAHIETDEIEIEHMGD